MIRLQRIGRTNDPSFRVVLTDKRNSPKSRNFKEVLGNYEVKKGVLSLKKDRILHWIKMGAKTSPTMHNFLVTEKIISGKKINVLPRKSPIKADVPAEAASEPVKEETEKMEPPAPKAEAPEPKEEVLAEEAIPTETSSK